MKGRVVLKVRITCTLNALMIMQICCLSVNPCCDGHAQYDDVINISVNTSLYGDECEKPLNIIQC